MTWRVAYSNRARRDLRSLEPSVTQRVIRALERLAELGQGDLRRLQGRDPEWRLRVGDWRALLALDTEARTLRVLRVRHRSEAYRQ